MRDHDREPFLDEFRGLHARSFTSRSATRFISISMIRIEGKGKVCMRGGSNEKNRLLAGAAALQLVDSGWTRVAP